MVFDMLGRELSIGDYVVFSNRIYRVEGLPTTRSEKGGVKIKLINPSPTTRAVWKYSKEVCIIPEADIIVWKLKREQNV